MATSARNKEAPRSDVFISYSRKDREFVKRLEAALQARGRKAWVDWEGIRPAERFMQAIFPAIEGTDTFVFVISPDSVTSDVCGKELAHAAAHNKRMVPIFAREVDAKTVPEPLAELNWVFFCRENEDFDVGTDTLISALDTDLDWVHAHTRLLTRAIEWQAKGKSNSFVLRGEDLRAAEQWLAQAGSDKERQPTALQTEYIIASRKASSKRQRITLGAVSFGLVLAIVLAVAAVIQRDKARASLSQSDFAEGTRLTNAGQPGRALPYFARAVRLTGHPSSATRIASLLTQRAWAIPVLSRTQPDATQAFYSRDGRHVLAAFRDGTIVLRVGATSQPGTVLARGRKIVAATFSPDGAALITIIASEDERAVVVQFWNADTAAQVGETMTVAGAEGHSVFWFNALGIGQDAGPIIFSPNGARAAVYAQEETSAAIWDVREGRKLFDLPQRSSGGSFSGDGERFASSELNTTVNVWKTTTGESLRRITPPDAREPMVTSFALSPDGSRLAVAIGVDPKAIDANGGMPAYARVYELGTGKPVTVSMPQKDLVRSVEFNADGRWLLIASKAGTGIWDSTTAKQLGHDLVNSSPALLRSAAFSPEGRRVLTLAEDGMVRVWDAATSQPLIEAFEKPGTEAVKWNADGRSVIVVDSDGVRQSVWQVVAAKAAPCLLPGRAEADHDFLQVTATSAYPSTDPENAASPRPQAPAGRAFVWDVRTAKKIVDAAMNIRGRGNNVFFSADGRRVALNSENEVRTWDIPTGRELTRITPGAHEIELNRDGTMALTVIPGEARLHDLEADHPPRKLGPVSSPVWHARLSPDGKFVATSSADYSVQVWETVSGTPRERSVIPNSTDMPELRFAPDGRHLFCSAEKSTYLWDFLKRGAIPKAIPGYLGDMCFNPAGSRMALHMDGGVNVLDTESGAPVWPPLLMKDSAPIHFTFSPNGGVLATLSSVCQLWDARTGKPLLDPIRLPDGGYFTSIGFSPDSARLILSGQMPTEEKFFTLVCDATNGMELWRADSKELPGESPRSHFTPDGCLLVIESDPTEVWDIAPLGKGPDFLADVAEAASGLRLSDVGALEPLPDTAAQRETLRKQVAGLPAENRWAQIARWFLAEPRTRTISPYSSVKVAD